MSEHVWSQEQIAAYLAGGLELDEAERLEQHARECPDCAAALTAATHLDRGLGTLFGPMRPKPGLEDRAVRALRTAPKPQAIFFVGWPRRIVAVAASIIVLTTFGALAATIMSDGRLPMPGESREVTGARIQREAGSDVRVPISPPALDGFGLPKDRKEDPGLTLQNEVGAPDLDKLAKATTDDIGAPDGRYSDLKPTKGREPSGIYSGGATPMPKGAGQPGTANGPFISNGGGFPGGGGGFNGGFGGGGIMGMGVNPMQPMMGYSVPPGGTQPTFGKPNQKDQLFSFYTGPLGGETATSKVPPVVATGLPPAVPVGPALPPAVPATVPSITPAATTYFHPSDAKPTDRILREAEALRARTEGKEESPKSKDDSNKGGDSKGDKEGLPSPKPSAPPPPTTIPTVPGAADPAPAPTPEPTRRIVIRSGDIEFEVESFDAALATVTKLALGIKGAFVGTVNSDKLPNGKVKGSIVVRTPPEFLDSLVLDLRKELGKGGDLKSVKLASADVTKQYTDLESRLKAARAMELRLLDIIKTGKGEIKQLLEAERELSVWRTKIEESEGEIRYLANLASLSALTITLSEKEIRSAVVVTENECVEAGVEVEDVDKAYQQLFKEVLDAKGRVRKSELTQVSAGQFNAVLNFEVAPESGGPIRDRLRQLGRVPRLKVYSQQDESAVVSKDAKVKRGDTQFKVQLYNLANVAPRETATLSVAVADVPTAYNALRDAIAKASGRVQVAQLNEQDKQNVTATLHFDVKRTDDAAIRAALLAAGESTSRQVTREPDSDAVTDTKILFKLTISALSRIRPRDVVTQQIVVVDVAATYQSIRETVQAAKGRVLASNLDQNDQQTGSASIDFEVPRGGEAAVKTALDSAGESVSRQIAHAAENEIATDTKVFYSLKLLPANNLKPRETTILGLEVDDVDKAMISFVAQLNAAKGRQIEAKSGRERNGKATARIVYEVPLAAASGLVEQFKNSGAVRVLNTSRDSLAPEGKSATARIEITLGNTDHVKPRETTTIDLEVADVEQTMFSFLAQLNEVKGRQIDAKSGRERNGKATARIVYEVPLATASGLVERFKNSGAIRVLNTTRDSQVPDGKSATAHIDITLANTEGIVAPDDTLWTPVKKGLTYSASFLLTSMTWIVFGLCVVLPWALLGYGGYRVVRRIAGPSPVEAPSAPVAPPAPEAIA